MAMPDTWIKLLKENKDEDWQLGQIIECSINVRSDEKIIAYCESHDQAIVGDKTISMWLFGTQIYTHMSKLVAKTPEVHRGVALHKMIRFLSSIFGDGYLNFMGNEFGHPEWVDFPGVHNNDSYKYCKRQWKLMDDNNLYYKDFACFDVDMLRVIEMLEVYKQWR